MTQVQSRRARWRWRVSCSTIVILADRRILVSLEWPLVYCRPQTCETAGNLHICSAFPTRDTRAAASCEAWVMTRLTPISRDAATPEQAEVFDAIAASRGGSFQLTDEAGGLMGPFNAMVTSPGIGARLESLGAAVRFESGIERRLLELAIVTVGAHWKANFEWWAHAPMARNAGISDAVLDAIQAGDTPTFEHADEETIYAFVQELIKTGRASDAVYNAAIEVVGEAGGVDLVATVGYYSLISLTLNAFEVPLPPGETEIWP